MRRDDQDEHKEPVGFVFHFQIANGHARKACRVRINAPNYHNATDLFRGNWPTIELAARASMIHATDDEEIKLSAS
jgi:hypothetical protein